MTMEQLSWFIDDTIARRLLSIPGMASVSRAGGVDREIRVVLDPAKMQALGVTASSINQALRQVNTDAAGGAAEIAGSRQSVRVLGNADSALELANTRISLGGGRESVVIGVSGGAQEGRQIALRDEVGGGFPNIVVGVAHGLSYGLSIERAGVQYRAAAIDNNLFLTSVRFMAREPIRMVK